MKHLITLSVITLMSFSAFAEYGSTEYTQSSDSADSSELMNEWQFIPADQLDALYPPDRGPGRGPRDPGRGPRDPRDPRDPGRGPRDPRDPRDPGRGPGRPRDSWICQARDFGGVVYTGTGFNMNTARTQAMQECRMLSRRGQCRLVGCWNR